ncbi:hypothetical protein DPMN_117841 [Dreissena polymorpha]|uniref:Uncharacterized protein n=1 Tax=Dreissena polymorpha TaxID=45954 RepID=A0A9D4GGA8_DREPO|nr:hypothetical protein DPMN_117841 [Dreissena polymorpha]
MYISLDWNTIAKEKFYDEGKAEKTFVVHETMNANPIKKQVIQLSDCIDLYTTTEKLGEQDHGLY